MASRHKSGFVSTVVLHIIDHVARYLLVAFGYWCSEASILKGVVLPELRQLQIFRILPLTISILFVDLDCFLVASWHLKSILVAWSVPVVLEAHLVEHPPHYLFALDVAFASSPAVEFEQSLFLCV